MQSEYLTKTDLAKRLGRSIEHVRRLRLEGKLPEPVHARGHHWLWTREQIEQWERRAERQSGILKKVD